MESYNIEIDKTFSYGIPRYEFKTIIIKNGNNYNLIKFLNEKKIKEDINIELKDILKKLRITKKTLEGKDIKRLTPNSESAKYLKKMLKNEELKKEVLKILI